MSDDAEPTQAPDQPAKLEEKMVSRVHALNVRDGHGKVVGLLQRGADVTVVEYLEKTLGGVEGRWAKTARGRYVLAEHLRPA